MTIYEKYPVFRCAHNEQQVKIDFIDNEWRLVFVPCYKKPQSRIASFPLDVVFERNFYELASEVKNYPLPKQHKYDCDEGCHPNRHICDWTHSPLTKVEVSICSLCNIKCKFCDVHNGKQQPELYKYMHDATMKCLYDLKDKGVEFICLTTLGEPLLWKEEIFKWLESFKPNTEDVKFNHHVALTTNFINFTDEDVERLIKIRDEKGIQISMSVSVSGTTKEEVENIQGCKIKDWDAYINRILKLYDNEIVTGINHVFTSYNVHTMEQFREFWKSKRPNIYLCPLSDCQNTYEVINSDYWKKYFETEKWTSENQTQVFYE